MIENEPELEFKKTKYLILASGTIGTTKLLLDYYKIYNEGIYLKHNPHVAILGFLRNIYNEKIKTIKGEVFYVAYKDVPEEMSGGLIGALTDDIVEIVCKKFYFVPRFIFKLFFSFLKKEFS